MIRETLERTPGDRRSRAAARRRYTARKSANETKAEPERAPPTATAPRMPSHRPSSRRTSAWSTRRIRSKTRSSVRACGRVRSMSTLGKSASSRVCESRSRQPRQRGEPLEHVLFYGPPGLGKTTLAGGWSRVRWTRTSVRRAARRWKNRKIWSASSRRLKSGDVFFVNESPPARPRRRRVSVSGDGGFPNRLHRQPRRLRQDAEASVAALYSDRCDHACRHVERAAARAFRYRAPSRLLRRCRNSSGSCAGRPTYSKFQSTLTPRRRSRRAAVERRALRTVYFAACATSQKCAPKRAHYGRSRRRSAGARGSQRAGPRPARPCFPANAARPIPRRPCRHRRDRRLAHRRCRDAGRRGRTLSAQVRIYHAHGEWAPRDCRGLRALGVSRWCGAGTERLL